ncbi:Hypothetical protein SRAE_X000128100 [Strongyloides ratti]|uniref:Uncharacterized protein n=1 Tax=Strongyloides ratti TaxID=34506 RepID=A0A090KQ75_STRRB|nr:Hypothetical protein SRAE_X000128100 [Strongyloides ratti]CEF59534.1 Hypothetical protein SRAE_X000128100 [Strongyloides ratti]
MRNLCSRDLYLFAKRFNFACGKLYGVFLLQNKNVVSNFNRRNDALCTGGKVRRIADLYKENKNKKTVNVKKLATSE